MYQKMPPTVDAETAIDVPVTTTTRRSLANSATSANHLHLPRKKSAAIDETCDDGDDDVEPSFASSSNKRIKLDQDEGSTEIDVHMTPPTTSIQGEESSVVEEAAEAIVAALTAGHPSHLLGTGATNTDTNMHVSEGVDTEAQFALLPSPTTAVHNIYHAAKEIEPTGAPAAVSVAAPMVNTILPTVTIATATATAVAPPVSPAATSNASNNNNNNHHSTREISSGTMAREHSTATTSTPSSRLSWADRLLQLVDYQNQHGDCLVPTRYKVNPSLGKWVHNQREQYKLYHKTTKPGYKKKCSMTLERIQTLEQAGFVWSTERSKRADEEWMARFLQLSQYQQDHGNTMVPHGYSVDPSLAEWVHRQRTTHATYYAHQLKPEQHQQQDATDGSAAIPNNNTEHKDTNNNSKKTTKNNPTTECFKTKERMEILESIGFCFTVQNDNWNERWDQLAAYKEQHGHCQVPTHYNKNKPLGRWVHTQRHQYRIFLKLADQGDEGSENCAGGNRVPVNSNSGGGGKKKSCMTQERIDKLNALGFNWEVRPALEQPRVTWQSRMEELEAYRNLQGHINVTQQENALLHRWISEQRQRLRQLIKHNGKDITKRMGPERVEELGRMGLHG